MKSGVGLWIDHSKAVIVTISEDGGNIEQIVSHAEKQLGRFNGIRSLEPFETRLVEADDRQQRIYTNQLNIFYEKVLSCLDNSESVLLFGPGEAKIELKKLMDKNHNQKQVVVIETVDKMTDPQIEAKVHKYFDHTSHKRRLPASALVN